MTTETNYMPHAQRVTQNELLEILPILFRAKRPAMVLGHPGTGKSWIIKQCAKIVGFDYHDILRPSTTNPVEACGIPGIVDGKTVFFPPKFLPDDINNGVVFHVDEFNSGAKANQAMNYQLTYDRVLGAWTMPESGTVVLTGNLPGSSSAIADKIASALANRCSVFVLESDAASFHTWAIQNNIDPVLRAFLRTREDALIDDPSNIVFGSGRSWADGVSPFMGIQDDNLRIKIIAGSVGITWSAYLDAFRDLVMNAPSTDSILADPMGVAVPSDLSICFALAAALSAIAKPDNFDSILAYCSRLGSELMEFAVTCSIARDSDLIDTAAYTARCLGDAQNRGVAS